MADDVMEGRRRLVAFVVVALAMSAAASFFIHRQQSQCVLVVADAKVRDVVGEVRGCRFKSRDWEGRDLFYVHDAAGERFAVQWRDGAALSVDRRPR